VPAPEVALREVRTDDLPAIFRHQADPESVAMAGLGPRDRTAFDEHWRRILHDPAVLTRAIVADGELAGTALSFEQGGRRMVGYWLDREHWGRGIATRALTLLLEEVTERPLHAVVSRHNAASLRIVEKHGFRVVDEDHDGAVLLELA
jgi:RimJ/RimL family protein N-acetyltransferase